MFRNLVSTKNDQFEFLRRIPIKTQQITLVHALSHVELQSQLNKLSKITHRKYILRIFMYSAILPLTSLSGLNPLTLMLQTVLSLSLLKNIQQMKGSLVLERVLKNNALMTTNTLNVGELKDLDKFEKENRIFLLKECLEE